MTIRLDNGFTTTIPNHELVRPYRDIDTAGRPIILNGTNTRALLINALLPPNNKDILLLGIPFLSASYLMVGNDNKQFKLAASSRVFKNARMKRDEDLVASLHPDCANIKPDSTNPTAGADSAGQSGSGTPDGLPPKTASTAQTGLIAGGICGGLVLLALVGVVIFCRGRRKANASTAREILDDPTKYPPWDQHYLAEVSSDGGVQYPVYEADRDSLRRWGVQPVQELEAPVTMRGSKGSTSPSLRR